MKPLISIIVPAYNIASYLSRCLDSILRQTYECLEIIVVDDGSKDNTGVIADEYVKQYPEKVKCFHIENGGVTNARLNGIVQSTGDWIGFIDGDDEIESDMYERLMHNARTYNADISHCGYQTIVNDGERIHYFYNTGRLVRQDKLTGLRDLLEGTFVEPGLWNKLYRRKLFEEILNSNVMDRDIKQNEDLLMNYLLFSESDLAVYEDFCPYHYMVRNDSATRVQFNKNKVYDPIKVAEWISEHVEESLQNIAERRVLRAYIVAYTDLCKLSYMKNETENLRETIVKQEPYWAVLNRNDKLKVFMIYRIPKIYKYIHNFYARYIQKKIYE